MTCSCSWNDVRTDFSFSSVLWPGDALISSYDRYSLERIARSVFRGLQVKNEGSSKLVIGISDEASIASETDVFPLIGYLPIVKSIAEKKVYPAVLYTFWIQRLNLNDFTKPFYGRNCTFPLGIAVPSILAQRKKREFECFISCISDQKPENIENVVIHNLCIGLNTLDQLLRGRLYFDGEAPGNTDAYVYSVLATLMLTVSKLPWKKASNYALEYQKLVEYVDRVSCRITANTIEPSSSESTKEVLSVPVLRNLSFVLLTISLIVGYCGWAKILVKSDFYKIIQVKLPEFKK